MIVLIILGLLFIWLVLSEYSSSSVLGGFEVYYDPETLKIKKEVWGLYHHGVRFSPEFKDYDEMKSWAEAEGIEFDYEHYGKDYEYREDQGE